jgi:hypothetical protein
MRALLAGVCALSLASTAFAQQTVVGGPGAPPASGGAGSPGGSSGQIQFNNSSAFGGISTLTNASGVITNSASATGATFQLTGTYTASTAAPMLYVDPAATVSSGFSATGTLIGANAVSGFTGNLLDLQLNGASKLAVNSTGGVTSVGNISFGSASALQRNGKTLIATAPTASSGGGMGTSPGAAVGSSSGAFTIAAGTGPTSGTFTLTFGTAATNGYICRGTDLTTPGNYIDQTAVTSTTVSTMQAYSRTTGLAVALTASDNIAFLCMGY